MPRITFGERIVPCPMGANLRREMMKNDLPLYNGVAAAIHCRGMGTCGTCAVRIDGPVTPMTRIEKWRLGFPPHRMPSPLRLACQCELLGDVMITKYPGLWGHRVTAEP